MTTGTAIIIAIGLTLHGLLIASGLHTITNTITTNKRNDD